MYNSIIVTNTEHIVFNKYELTLLKDVILPHYAKEYNRREHEGLTDETIKAQLQGLFDVLVKININLNTISE